MNKKPKQKKKVVVDERGIERIGDRPIEYVDPKDATFQVRDSVAGKGKAK